MSVGNYVSLMAFGGVGEGRRAEVGGETEVGIHLKENKKVRKQENKNSARKAIKKSRNKNSTKKATKKKEKTFFFS